MKVLIEFASLNQECKQINGKERIIGNKLFEKEESVILTIINWYFEPLERLFR